MAKRFVRCPLESVWNEVEDKSVYNNSIVFIEDTRRIIVNGKTYPTTEGSPIKFLAEDGTYKEIQQEFIRYVSNAQLKFYCIEPVTITINDNTETFDANSIVSKTLNFTDVLTITPMSNNSIMTLDAWPGVLDEFYPWLEGVQVFSNITFDMNDIEMYKYWSQYYQGRYHVQQAQYINCIFWSDRPFILTPMSNRNNYTLNRSSNLPLCYSSIPENTFKPFYCCYGVVNDPNLSNQNYLDSFAATTTNTSPWSYYYKPNIGSVDDMEHNIIKLPTDSRGLMYASPSIITAGVFDAELTTNFGATATNWQAAFGNCTSLHTLLIRNLNTSINLSWSPITINSLQFIIANAINTSAITIYLSPVTYYSLTDTVKTSAVDKNITLSLITGNYPYDNRLIVNGDGTKYLTDNGTYQEFEIDWLNLS